MSTEPRPLFVYGTLRALPLLAWALTGEATKVDQIFRPLRKGLVHGYRRCSLHRCDYPAAIHDPRSSVDGYLLAPLTASQRRKLDAFEGETYKITPVMVTILDENDQPTEDTTEADIYIWNQDLDAERLEDWLELYKGMELIGDD
ncbi:hypothetical protein B0H67DRAFT_598358 [Lasiosphaeris hirsuta]|uniref:Putative gamma-glutamylcyclotransferase n=1 Tax=Lasiosphaeris hirsuta TaxID=260670 RepID=A0AA40AZN1_9PEZI|nr:hypothetical protein B0H67DRAFT_598358 [Lasiosphaeris hirsuta]